MGSCMSTNSAHVSVALEGASPGKMSTPGRGEGKDLQKGDESSNQNFSKLKSSPSSVKENTKMYNFKDPVTQEEEFKKKYKVSSELGSGAHSVVKLAYNNKEKKMVAVKIVSSCNLPEEDIEALDMEIKILGDLHHPNIIELLEVYKGKEEYYIITELVQGGELFDRIVNKTFYSELEARDLIKLFIETIAFIHSKGICHRDLKPENLLLVSEDDDSELKIADFGYAKKIESLHDESPCGTPGYVAPEILRGDAYQEEVDIWSMGVICYVLLAGYPPFYDEDTRKLYKKIKNGKYEFHDEHWSAVSEDAKDLITKMLTVDQKERWTAVQLLEHKWITSGNDMLSSRGLSSTIENMKKFNARTKFKAAARAVIVSNRMSVSVKSQKGSDEQTNKMLLPHQVSFVGKRPDMEIVEDENDE